MRRFVQSFPFLMVMAVCGHAACGDSEQGTGSTGVGPVGSQGTGYSPACNLDRRDGYCNMLGQNPETCECFDCVDSAKCMGRCNDNGICEDLPEVDDEDCTCADCAGSCNANPDVGATTTDATTDATTVTSGGGGPATTTNSTTDATTTTGMGGMGMGGAGGA